VPVASFFLARLAALAISLLDDCSSSAIRASAQLRPTLFAFSFTPWRTISVISLRTLALPDAIKEWSLTSLREKLIKIGATVVSHGRYVAFQMAEVAMPRKMFAAILRLIADLRSAQGACRHETPCEGKRREICAQVSMTPALWARGCSKSRPKASNVVARSPRALPIEPERGNRATNYLAIPGIPAKATPAAAGSPAPAMTTPTSPHEKKRTWSRSPFLHSACVEHCSSRVFIGIVSWRRSSGSSAMDRRAKTALQLSVAVMIGLFTATG
jgi:hypothetical protein